MSLPWDTPATTNLDTTTTKKKKKKTKNTMSEDAPVLTKKQRAAALLKESTKSVIKEAFYMKRGDGPRGLLALKHASQMLGELRTSLLSPMNYYELYMKVCDELMYLEMFFGSKRKAESRTLWRCTSACKTVATFSQGYTSSSASEGSTSSPRRVSARTF